MVVLLTLLPLITKHFNSHHTNDNAIYTIHKIITRLIRSTLETLSDSPALLTPRNEP